MYFTVNQIQAAAPELGAVTEPEIKTADEDINLYLPWERNQQIERVDLDKLSETEEYYFKLAVIEEIKFRRHKGPAFFIDEEYSSVSTKDFSTSGTLPKISQRTVAYLRRAGLLGKHKLGKVRSTNCYRKELGPRL